MANVGQGNGVRDADATFVFLLEDNVGRILVDSNTEALKLGLDDSFISERFVDIEDNENKMACLSNSNDLTTSTFAVFSSLNYTR